MKRIKRLISMFIALLICLLSGCADKELSAPNGAVVRYTPSISSVTKMDKKEE